MSITIKFKTHTHILMLSNVPPNNNVKDGKGMPDEHEKMKPNATKQAPFTRFTIATNIT